MIAYHRPPGRLFLPISINLIFCIMSPTNLDDVAAITQNKLDDKSLSSHDISYVDAVHELSTKLPDVSYCMLPLRFILTGVFFRSVESVNGCYLHGFFLGTHIKWMYLRVNRYTGSWVHISYLCHVF